jgi:phospholipid-binding lipoprotein MlaA
MQGRPAAASGGWIWLAKNGKNAAVFKGYGRVMRAGRALLLGLCGLLLAACAATPPPEALGANDPFEAANRDIMVLNGHLDEIFFKPTLQRYRWLPEEVRAGIHNFLRNLSAPTIFLNDVLQAEPDRAGQTMGRFVINSSLGIGGLFDPAAKMGLPQHGEDFGQTLAVWGVDEGPFLMLPFLGPSNPRDVTGLAVDTFLLDPTNYVHFKQHIYWAGGRQYLNVLDLRSQTFETLQGIERSSVDYYAALRNLYRQNRAKEIRNGKAANPADLPDF